MMNNNPMYGSYVATAMATALFQEHFSHPYNSRRDKVLLSAPRHSNERRMEYARIAEQAGIALANAKSSDEEDDAIWSLKKYSKFSKSGLDAHTHWDAFIGNQVRAMLIIRQLKNDARKLKRLAYATEFNPVEALGAPTSVDYRDWARHA